MNRRDFITAALCTTAATPTLAQLKAMVAAIPPAPAVVPLAPMEVGEYRGVIVHLQGSDFSADQVRQLVKELNNANREGGEIIFFP